MGKNRKQIAAELRGTSAARKAYLKARAKLDEVPAYTPDGRDNPDFWTANERSWAAKSKQSRLERLLHS